MRPAATRAFAPWATYRGCPAGAQTAEIHSSFAIFDDHISLQVTGSAPTRMRAAAPLATAGWCSRTLCALVGAAGVFSAAERVATALQRAAAMQRVAAAMQRVADALQPRRNRSSGRLKRLCAVVQNPSVHAAPAAAPRHLQASLASPRARSPSSVASRAIGCRSAVRLHPL
jgi:hypothetical protein